MTRRARVLVVEDEPEFVDVLQEDLSERASSAASGIARGAMRTTITTTTSTIAGRRRLPSGSE